MWRRGEEACAGRLERVEDISRRGGVEDSGESSDVVWFREAEYQTGGGRTAAEIKMLSCSLAVSWISKQMFRR